jgi:hypothetical protein
MLLVIAGLWLVTGRAFGQEITGTIAGQVLDMQGPVAPGATVTVAGPQGDQGVDDRPEWTILRAVPCTRPLHGAS